MEKITLKISTCICKIVELNNYLEFYMHIFDGILGVKALVCLKFVYWNNGFLLVFLYTVII